jgi:hypothetical protein
MAITEGLSPALEPALARQKPVFRKQNVPPFRAARGKHSMLAAVTVNTPRDGLPALREESNPQDSGAVEKPDCNA